LFQISRDYPSAIRICDDAEKYLFKHPHLTPKHQFEEFYLQKLSCYLNLQEYEMGKETITKCEESIPTGFPNWFVYMELYFQLAMHTEHFPEAEAVFNTVMENPRYPFQPDHKKEFWKLLELYLKFAISLTSDNSSVSFQGSVDIN